MVPHRLTNVASMILEIGFLGGDISRNSSKMLNNRKFEGVGLLEVSSMSDPLFYSNDYEFCSENPFCMILNDLESEL